MVAIFTQDGNDYKCMAVYNIVAAFLFASKTFRLLLFAKFNTKIFSFPMVLCKKVYLCNII